MQKSFGILLLIIGIAMIVFGASQYSKEHKSVKRSNSSTSDNSLKYFARGPEDPESQTEYYVLFGGGVLLSIIGGIMIWHYKKGQNLHS